MQCLGRRSIKKVKMLQINPEEDEVKVSFNKQFYPVEILKETLEDFKGACDGSIEEKERLVVTLKPKDKSHLSVIGYEFCNYALALMKHKVLV